MHFDRSQATRTLRFAAPNAVTTLAIFMGFLSIQYSLREDFLSAAWFIFFAGMVDAVDGGIAKKLNATSAFGAQFDSLADVVVVGVAPSVLIYNLYFADNGFIGILISFMPLMFSSLRLARYNVTQGGKDYFQGLSAPMAANLHASFVLFSYGVWNEYLHESLVVVMVIATSFLMISTLSYEKAHFFGPKLIFRSPIGWLVLLTVVIGFWVPEVVIFPYALYFVLGGLLRGLFKTYSTRLRAA